MVFEHVRYDITSSLVALANRHDNPGKTAILLSTSAARSLMKRPVVTSGLK